MEPLFETDVTYTYEEHLKFNRALAGGRKIPILSGLWVFYVVVFVLVLISYIWMRDIFELGTFLSLLFFAVPVLLFNPFPRRSLKKTYESNKMMQNQHNHLRFFSDYLESQSEYSHLHYPYDLLYTIVETDTNFYLMTGRNTGIIVIKDVSTPGLTTFLQDLKRKTKEAHRR